MRFHTEMTMKEVLRAHPGSKDILIANGITCIDCLGARLETVRKVSQTCGLDPFP
ncbi:MAG: DUF1858 domain-containing protein [Actinomycetota bacterium]|nr:DUF1858 domain-containing protein [Actinomycetota bacterium]